jgi:type VI secretion system FHA domain protein
MRLTLSMLRCPDSVVPETRSTGGGEFSIGRAPDNAWVLPDPDRHLSKRHCLLAFRSGGWQIADLSANGTYLNRESEPIGHGQVRDLQDMDRIRLGPYEIEVRLEEERAAPGPAAGLSGGAGGTGASGGFGGFDEESIFSRPRAPAAPPPVPRQGPFADPGLGAERAPWDEEPLFPARAPSGPAGLPEGASLPDHTPAYSDAMRMPAPPIDDSVFEGLDDLLAPVPAAAPKATPQPAPPAVPPAIPDDFGEDLLAPAPRPAPPPAPPAIPDDFGDDLLAPAAAPKPAVPPAAPPEGFGAPPPVAAPVAAVPPRAVPAPAAAMPAGDDALLAAFLRGAAMEDARPADPVAMMESLGASFRAFVSGLRAAMIARHEIKGELRIEQTQIRARGNNPLKFSADDDDALSALLGTGRRAGMPPAAAVAEALRDLRLHELATFNAMQAAVRSLMAELAPAKVQAAAGEGGLLPVQRKARAWETYEAQHAALVARLADDFDSAFGKAFARAYEQAMDEAGRREDT